MKWRTNVKRFCDSDLFIPVRNCGLLLGVCRLWRKHLWAVTARLCQHCFGNKLKFFGNCVGVRSSGCIQRNFRHNVLWNDDKWRLSVSPQCTILVSSMNEFCNCFHTSRIKSTILHDLVLLIRSGSAMLIAPSESSIFAPGKIQPNEILNKRQCDFRTRANSGKVFLWRDLLKQSHVNCCRTPGQIYSTLGPVFEQAHELALCFGNSEHPDSHFTHQQIELYW